MRITTVTRRSVATLAVAALVSTGLGTSSALAAPGDPVVTGVTPSAASNSGTVPLTINGTGFVPFLDTVDLIPLVSGPKVSDFTATMGLNPDPTTSSTTALKIDAPLSLAPPGGYQVVVHQNSTDSAPCTCFSVTSNGPANVTGSVLGDPGPSGSPSRNALALDINGSFFAVGGAAEFLTADGTAVDPTLTFTPGNPADTTSDVPGYPSSTLIQGNYSYNHDAVIGGKRQLRVRNTDGQLGATAEFWQPTFPQNGVSPSSRGAGSQNQIITVTGVGIRAGSHLNIQNRASSGSDVSVGASTVSADGTRISAPFSFTANASNLPRWVSISGPDGASYAQTDVFTVNAPPSITTLNNNTLGQGAVQDVTVNGANFSTVPGSPPVFDFGGNGVTGVVKTINSATSVVVTITVARDATLGARNIKVTNPDGGTTTRTRAISEISDPLTIAVGPTIGDITPPAVGRPTTRSVIISGTDFDTSGVTVQISQQPAAGQPRVQDPKIHIGAVTVTAGSNGDPDTASFSVTTDADAPAGVRDVRLTNGSDFGSDLCIGCFGIDSLGVAPPSAANTAAASLTLSGTGFVSGATAQLIATGDPTRTINATSVTPGAGGTSATAVFPLTNEAPGRYNMKVVTGGSTLVCTACFYVTGQKPTVSAIAPNNGGQGAKDLLVTLTGTHFSKGEKITIAGLTVHDVAFVSPTQITAKLDIPTSATTGAKDVVVTNADDENAADPFKSFTVNPGPVPSSALPAYGQGASGVNITVKGKDFVSGATAAFGTGITVTDIVVTQGVSTGPTDTNPDDTLVAAVNIAESAPVGAHDVTITNPDKGIGKLTGGFTVNAGPKPTSVSPSALAPGSSKKTLTITGTGFSHETGKLAVPIIAGVSFDSTKTTVNSAGTVITAVATVTSSVRGPRSVYVRNADDGVGSCACFAIAAPPAAPTGLKATGGDKSITVTWTAPTDNGGAAIEGYNVSAKHNGTPAGTPVSAAATDRSAKITGLTNDATYTITVVARSIAGTGTPASVTGVAGVLPAPPTVVGAKAGDGAALVSWNAADGKGKTITEYTVTAPGSGLSSRVTSGTARSLTFSGLTNGVAYRFQIKAKSSAGYGAYSALTSTVTPKWAITIVHTHSPTTIKKGESAIYSGKLYRTRTNVPLGAVQVFFSVTPQGSTTPIRLSVTTNSSGVWAFRRSPSKTETVRANFGGDSDDAPVNAPYFIQYVTA